MSARRSRFCLSMLLSAALTHALPATAQDAPSPGIEASDQALSEIGALLREGSEREAYRRIGEITGGPTELSEFGKPEAAVLRDASRYVGASGARYVAVNGIVYRLLERLGFEPHEVAMARYSYAAALQEEALYSEAEAVWRVQLAHYRACCTIDSGGALDAAVGLAQTLEAQRRFGEADAVLAEIWNVALGFDDFTNIVMEELARARARNLIAAGQPRRAYDLTAEVLARGRATDDLSQELAIDYRVLHGRSALATERYDEAERLAREAIAVGRPDGEWIVIAALDTPEADARELLADALEAQGRYAAAEPIRRNLLAKIEDNFSIPKQYETHRPAMFALARNLATQGKAESLALLARQAAAIADIFGSLDYRLLPVVELAARERLERADPGALFPARKALAIRLAEAERERGADGSARAAMEARERRQSATLLVRAAWSASTR
ncbi:tetratricopeptide repeat protein [Pseudoblastomonas halimionae]|uniref:Tetratricopeptide repeat protein n=1 Tax=Alteriqipengyuania halimionae TaxID=1926630 RepID=A0A6I4TYH6_9SPHN|nr:hypothetical protein [Alteriqipengyuania halimionae]MXP08710.1 hypothetical protein [Alteriqipengyuania halimionae]